MTGLSENGSGTELRDTFAETGLLRVDLTQRAGRPQGHVFFDACVEIVTRPDALVFDLVSQEPTEGARLTVRRTPQGHTELELERMSGPVSGAGSAASASRATASANTSGTGNGIKTETFGIGNARVSVTRVPFALEVRDPAGAVLWATAPLDLNVGSVAQSAAVRWSSAGWGMSLAFENDEVFYGTGEDFGPFVKNGRRRSVINSDALGNHEEFVYQNAPHIVSNQGRAFEVGSDVPFGLDVGAARQGVLTLWQQVPKFSLRIHNAPSVDAVVRSLRSQQRAPRGVPDWAFGLWLSRCYYADEPEIRSVLRRARELDIPVGTINLDARCWMRPTHRTDFVPDPERYPDFFGLVKSILDQGTQVCLWENPYVSSISHLYEEGCRNGFFARTRDGHPYPYQWVPVGLAGFPQTPPSGLVDFTNPQAVRWWQDQHLPFLKAGIRCFKTDFGEEIPADAVFADGRSGFELRNAYSDLYNLAVSEVMEEVLGDQGIIWARSGYRHTQATPVKWAGDGQTDWRSLQATLRAGLSQAFGGALFWSHDVGGFYGPLPDPELFLRWSQCALWGSHIRLHGTTPREPWEFGERVLHLFRVSLGIRSELEPYFRESARDCVRVGLSFLRPMVFEEPTSLACQHVDDAFFAGRDLLVAPFLRSSGGREIWLPRGEWRDLRTGRLHAGERQIHSERTDFLPVFARAESRYSDLFARATRVIMEHTPGGAP